jgi:hypothetical protein
MPARGSGAVVAAAISDAFACAPGNDAPGTGHDRPSNQSRAMRNYSDADAEHSA